MSLASQIKTLALSLGFDQMGITRPSQLQEGENYVRQWVKEGKHGSMKFLEDFEERRARFFHEFPDAKSVIVLGVNYYSGVRHPQGLPVSDTRSLAGRVARYAWGKDYHLVIRKRHHELIEKIKGLAGDSFKAVSCVDTQPIPERYAAQKAGLGFLGKHTGLLSAEFGPWLFLSEIVTNLELDEDLPATGDCGTCDHCQKVCPTGALNEDYDIDARLCIAYLTIEHKGIIPRELRPQVKDWVFGCDECLAICPFTSKSKGNRWPELGAEAGVGEWLAMDALFGIQSNREYENFFAGTALMRTNRKQMLRNACLVLGNSKRPEALPYLKKALEDTAPLVRVHAAWALGQFGTPESRAILAAHQSLETDPDVLAEINY